MQACLYEFAQEVHAAPLNLDPEDFKHLPPSSLNNVADYKLFEDYTKSDLEIECLRAAKYQ